MSLPGRRVGVQGDLHGNLLALEAICDRTAASAMRHAERLCETQRAASRW